MQGLRENWPPRILLRSLFRENEWKTRAGEYEEEKQFEGRKVRAWVTLVMLEGLQAEAWPLEMWAEELGQETDLEFGSNAVCVVEDVEWGVGGILRRRQEGEKKKRERSTSGRCWPLLKNTQQRRPGREKGQEKAATWQKGRKICCFSA